MDKELKYLQLIACAFGILLFVNPAFLFALQIPSTRSDIPQQQNEGSEPQPSFIPSYISHDPINITSNADFVSQGYSGVGTIVDPYLIIGYNITTIGECISIQNTTAYFVIRDCFLTGGLDDLFGIHGIGVELLNVTNGVIRNNTIQRNIRGVYIYQSSNNTVVNNTIAVYEDEGYAGSCVSIRNSSTNTIVNNTFSGNNHFSGVSISSSSDIILSANMFRNNGIDILGKDEEFWRHNITTDNMVNEKPIGYFWNLTSSTIDGSQYGQVVLANCTSVIVENGMFSNTSHGIELGYSSFCTLSNNTMSGNSFGVVIFHSSNNTLDNNTISRNSFEGVFFYDSNNNTLVNNSLSENIPAFAITLVDSSFNTIVTNNFSGNHVGMSLASAQNNSIISNNFFENVHEALVFHSSSNNLILNNNVTENYGDGLEFHTSSNNSIINNSLSENYGDGLSILYSSNNVFQHNNISDNGMTGAWLYFSSNNTFVSNNILRNQDGMYIRNGGRDEDTSDNNLIYLNVFADNEARNSYDEGGNNHWNLTTTGNLWSNYNGTGVLLIPGSAGSIDHYPSIYPADTFPPVIDSPEDVEYEVGTIHNNVTWNPSDDYPSHYEIYQNGTEIASDSWNGSSITVEVDGLSVGIYDYTLIVYDTSGNWSNNTVLVIVIMQTSVTTTSTTSITSPNGDEIGLVIVFFGLVGIEVVIAVLIILRYRKDS